jgi:hypothetical protein
VLSVNESLILFSINSTEMLRLLREEVLGKYLSTAMQRFTSKEKPVLIVMRDILASH